MIAISMMDLQPLMEKYGITSYSAQPHNLEEFSIELGVAHWNDLKFVPERTFDDVIRGVTALQGLEDWKPGAS